MLTVWEGGLTTAVCPPTDDPALWDFTLDAIDGLDAPADDPHPKGLRPTTPSSHKMHTRSKTPQGAPDRAPSYSGAQDPAQCQAGPGEAS